MKRESKRDFSDCLTQIPFLPGKSLLWYCTEGWLRRAVSYQYAQAWKKSVAKLWAGVATVYDFQQNDYKIWGCS